MFVLALHGGGVLFFRCWGVKDQWVEVSQLCALGEDE